MDAKTESKTLQLQKTVNLTWTNPDTGITYAGDFTMKRMTLLEISQMGADISRRTGGLNVDEITETIATMMAQLRFSLVAWPEWFSLDQLYHMDLLTLVFREVREFLDTFRRSPAKAAPGSDSAGEKSAR